LAIRLDITSTGITDSLIIAGGQCIPALYGAPLKTSIPLPVIVFSHGVAGMRTTYSAVCCDLASHGYLVAAVEHRYGTYCVCFNE